ncbi:uncharacterized protein TNCV_68021 [Trichonephila clavipes]|nr:uncharacterized protein TNCV_68021 [Trichonephila clavipes]
MISALAYLPMEHIDDAWSIIWEKSFSIDKLTTFMDYLVEQWMDNPNMPIKITLSKYLPYVSETHRNLICDEKFINITQDIAARGWLVTDLVVLNDGQVTRTTPELAPHSSNFHATTDLKRIRSSIRRIFSGTRARTHDTATST